MQKCGGPGSNEGTVESLNRFGHPELIETLGAERAFWCPSNRASSTKIRFCVSWHGGKRHQTGQGERANPVSATRELHGVIMDPEHVALAWCVRFAGQIISCTVKSADGLTAFQHAFHRASHPQAMPAAWGRKDLGLGSEQREGPDHRQVFRRYLLGHQKKVLRSSLSKHLLVGWYAELSEDGLVKWPREDAAHPVFFNSIRGTPKRLLPDDVPREWVHSWIHWL